MKKICCNHEPFTNRSFLFIFFIALFSFSTFYAKAGDSIAIIPSY
ncbi:MAG: hypothetical protein ABI359_00985 [Ginsengibacter sp.]